MRISPVSMNGNFKSNTVNFGKKEESSAPKTKEQKLAGVPEGKKVVMCRWDNTYVYPVLVDADDDDFVFASAPKPDRKKDGYTPSEPVRVTSSEETPEEYLKRKISSTEWTM